MLNWEKMKNIPEEWEIVLIDGSTDESINFKPRTEYEFYFDIKKKETERFYVTVNRNASTSTEEENTPTVFRLKKNYPNPFNPVTIIEYELPKYSEVKIEVFDILGRTVATLIDERKSAGFHSVLFNASHLSSGTYFYRINAGDFVQIKSMMLIK